MNGQVLTVWGRLLWKEYRLQRAYWLVLGGAGMLGMWMLGAWVVDQEVATVAATAIGVVVPCLYAGGSAASLFAAERENNTLPFQQMLPVTGPALFAAKMAFAIASTLLMVGVLAAMASSDTASLTGMRQALQRGLLAVFELLAWCGLLSLLVRHALTAALVGGGLVVVLNAVSLPQLDGNWHTALYGARAAGAGAALAAATAIASRRLIPGQGCDAGTSLADARAKSTILSGRSAFRPLGRLMWQEWRRTWKLQLLMWLVLLLAVPFLLASGHGGSQLAFALPLSLICGVCCFDADKRQRSYRQLGWIGVSPSLVWLARQLQWGGAALLMAAVVVASCDSWALSTMILGVTAVAYCSGQLCSLLIRRSVTAFATALLLCWLVVSWAALMGLWSLRVEWSVAPIPLLFLVVSRWRLSDWLLERPRPLAVSIALATPLAALFSAVVLVRAYGIPLLDESAQRQLLEPAAGQEPSGEVAEAAGKLLAAARASQSLDSDEAVARVVQLADSPGLQFVSGGQPLSSTDLGFLHHLSAALLDAAVERREQGQLAEAWACHRAALQLAAALRCHGPSAHHTFADRIESDTLPAVADWGARAGQSPEQIDRARRWLRDRQTRVATRMTVVPWSLDELRRSLAVMRRQQPWTALDPSHQQLLLPGLLPWESVRYERLFLQALAAQQRRWQEAAAPRAMLHRRPLFMTPPFTRWLDQTSLSQHCRQWLEQQHLAYVTASQLQLEHRVTRLTLAIQAQWRRGGGRFEALDASIAADDPFCLLDPTTGGRIQWQPPQPHTAASMDRPSMDGSSMDGSSLDGSSLDGSLLDGSSPAPTEPVPSTYENDGAVAVIVSQYAPLCGSTFEIEEKRDTQ